MNGYKSRKFIAFMTTIGLAFVSFWFGNFPADAVTTITTVATGSYMVSNAAEKFSKGEKS